MKIRSDLEGVVYAQSEGGVVCLAAGDTIPGGVDVGEHLTTEPEDDLDDADESNSDSDSDSDENAGDGDGDDAGESDTEDDDPRLAGRRRIEKGTEHARGRRGRRSTPGSGSDA